MTLPHEISFHYRPALLALVLIVAIGVAVSDRSGGADRAWSAAFILVSCLGAYGMMRAFVSLAVRPIAAARPRLVRVWSLVWFYGVIPVSVVGAYFGAYKLHAHTPGVEEVAGCVAFAAAMAAGSFPAIRASADRLTSGWSGP